MNKIIYSVDVQNDFMNETGKLYVPDSESIKQNIKKVYNIAADNGILIVGSMDAHDENDVEFETFPKHCVIDTDGQNIITECKVYNQAGVYTVPNNGNGIDINVAEYSYQVMFEKQCVDIWDKIKGQPDNLQTLLRFEEVNDVYVVGVALEYCVKAAIEGFLERKYKVTVVVDCVKGIDSVASEEVLNDSRVECITSDEFVKIIKKEDL